MKHINSYVRVNGMTKHHKIVMFIFQCFILFASVRVVMAAPVDPTIRNVESEFAYEVLSKFYLFGDTEDPGLIWFVPKFGTIAQDNTGFNQPEFDIGSIVSEHPDYYPGEELVWFSGAFDTRGLESDIAVLSRLAAQKGYRILAAKPKAAETYFIVDGVDVQSLDLDCTAHMKTALGDFPMCFVFDQQGRRHPAEFVAKLDTVLPENTMSDYVGFRGMTVPSWRETLKRLMGVHLPSDDPAAGQNWNDKLQVVTVWSLETHYNQPRGQMYLHWNTLVQQFSAYENSHPALLSLTDIKRKIRLWVNAALIGQNAPFFLQTYGADNDVDLITEAIFHVFKNNNVFVPVWVFPRHPVQRHVSSAATRVEQRMIPIVNSSISFFVPAEVKVKPELRFAVNRSRASRHEESIDLYFGPNVLISNPQTHMYLECLHGGWHMQVRWAQTPACLDTHFQYQQNLRISREALQAMMP
ncbi:hypothetical protein [Photobacterium sp. 1_MG-2023]|uniref:hypothetical protein n=1 Tax=Photobacterium sp. 1_MG-2023 TaxID=3062646 RepID=UPI0026E3B84B|nr:hypothetical protein [Photobacterium sp. 1_MG-2023]MDO6705304.1 hypothetical protein [Photobacterium sp. 1_MG-2023]